MKKTLIGFSVAMVLFLVIAATMPLFNSFLQSDMNGNGFSITNLNGLTATGTVTAAQFGGGGAGVSNVQTATFVTTSPLTNATDATKLVGIAPSTAMPALTGAVTNTAGTVATGLNSTGVTPGTYTKLTVGYDGRATSGTTLTNSDLPSNVATNNGDNHFSTAQTFDGSRITGTLTNATTGNAATATVASFVSGTLTNSTTGNAATATLASFVSGTLTNSTTGNAATATLASFVSGTLTNNTTGNAATATTATTATTASAAPSTFCGQTGGFTFNAGVFYFPIGGNMGSAVGTSTENQTRTPIFSARTMTNFSLRVYSANAISSTTNVVWCIVTNGTITPIIGTALGANVVTLGDGTKEVVTNFSGATFSYLGGATAVMSLAFTNTGANAIQNCRLEWSWNWQ